MTTQTIEPTTLPEWNGHFKTKGAGKNLYDGPLHSLPMPTGPVSSEEQIAAMYSDGYVIFPGVLSPEEVARWRSNIDAFGGPDEQYEVEGWCFNKQIGPMYMTFPESLELIDRPGIIEVVEAIHGVPFSNDGGAVMGGSFWVTGNGRQMPVHIDYQMMRLPEAIMDDPTIRVPIYMSTAHYYLQDMTLDLGPTTIVPGSHKSGRWPENETSFRGVAPQAALVNAGDVVLFRSDLWHGAGMNSSKERRYIIQVHYAASNQAKWFPAMRFEKYWSEEVLAKATPRQRKLLGAMAAPVNKY